MLKFLRKRFQRIATAPEPRHPSARSESVQPRQVEERRSTEEQFDQVVAMVSDYAIFLLSPKGYVASWNTGAERMKGYRAEEIVGQHFSRFYPADIAATGLPDQELQEASAKGRFEDEGWRLRKDGSRFWANVIITALRNQSGEVRGFLKITRDLTERKRSEENARRLLEEEAGRRAAQASALEAQRAQREERRQREQLHVTLTSIGDAVIVTDVHGNVTFLNPVAETLTGWKAEEAAGQPIIAVFHIVNEDTREPVDNPVDTVIREGSTVGLANHIVLISKDGREIPIDDSGAPIRGEEGTIVGAVLVFRDVTEARRATDARLHLAAVVEYSEDAIFSKNFDGTVLSWNRAAQQLYGYTADEMIGQPASLLFPVDRADELPALMERLKRGERIAHFETVRVRKDGKRVDISLTISPIRSASGKIVAASAIARDITASKRQESGLRFLAGASKLLAELLDVSSTLQRVAGLAVPQFADWCAVDLLNPDGSLQRVAVAHVDPAKVQLAHTLHRRYPADPAAPLGMLNILRTGKSELLSEIPDSLLKDAAADDELLGILRELGLRSYIGVPLAVRGKMLGVITFVAAESGRQYGAADLKLAEDLAQRAAIAIENAQLYSELREGDRRKDEFLAMLAHELRNPLAPIRSALQVMKTAGANAETVEQAREVTERQVQHLVRLVDDLLDVSRIMRGRIELRKQPVELAAVIARAIETAQPMLDSQHQQLVLTVPSDPLWVEADPTRLAQVVSNLVHNAAKFSEPSSHIALSAERNGTDVVLRVRDEGAGIRGDLLPHIFDLFVQGDRSLERSQGGLGIGLTVVRELIESHGGTITVHSEGPGKGSEFVVRLPALREAPRQMPSDSDEGDRPAPVSASRRILVVDDNVDAAESIAVLLGLWGYEVQLAHNGPEALRAAEKYQPEVIVLDIGLPEMSGYEVAQRLQQDPYSKKAVLVAVTGYGQEDDRRRSRAAGFDYHLTKPVDPSALQQLLASLSPGPNRVRQAS